MKAVTQQLCSQHTLIPLNSQQSYKGEDNFLLIYETARVDQEIWQGHTAGELGSRVRCMMLRSWCLRSHLWSSLCSVGTIRESASEKFSWHVQRC